MHQIKIRKLRKPKFKDAPKGMYFDVILDGKYISDEIIGLTIECKPGQIPILNLQMPLTEIDLNLPCEVEL